MMKSNTFFIVEVVRALAEEVGSLELIGTRALPQHVFAGGVQTVVARRLNRAPEGARPLLKLAAVAGRKLDRRVLGVGEPELERWLQVLTDAAILEATEAEWRFSHDKLRERLLASLDDDERRQLHRRIGEAMEVVYGRSGAQVCAQGSGSALLKMMASSMQAAVDCRAGAFDMAQQHLALALALLARVQPPTMHYLEGYAAALDAALALRQAASAPAERARTERQLGRALGQLGWFAMKFPVGRPRVLIGLGRYLWLHGRQKGALRSLYRGLAQAARLRMPAEQARAHLWLGRLGHSAAAVGVMDQATARRHLEQAAQQFRELQMSFEGLQAERALGCM